MDITTPIDATITEYLSYETLREMYDKATADVDNLTTRLDSMTRNWEFSADKVKELNIKIGNVKGAIEDYYSENGELTDELTDIAKYLDIELMKEISGTATFEISFSAKVPLGFDVDDFDLSFEVDADNYDTEEFDWQEESRDINAEDNY